MKKAIILGSTNVGKTLFMLNFAQYLGIQKIFIRFEYPDGKVLNKELSIETAKNTLSSNTPHKTKCLQSIKVKIPIYKGVKEIEIMDTSGLIDGIHPDINIRSSIIQTLDQIINSHLILHMIDVSLVYKKRDILSQIDRQIINFGKNRGKYVLLANKIDLDYEGKGINYINETINGIYIIPISALYKKGFNEVKTFVINSI